MKLITDIHGRVDDSHFFTALDSNKNKTLLPENFSTRALKKREATQHWQITVPFSFSAFWLTSSVVSLTDLAIPTQVKKMIRTTFFSNSNDMGTGQNISLLHISSSGKIERWFSSRWMIASSSYSCWQSKQHTYSWLELERRSFKCCVVASPGAWLLPPWA